MRETSAPSSLSRLQTAVLRTVVYSDLFDFPLTADEVHHYLPVAAARDDVRAAIAELGQAGFLSSSDSYVMLAGREELVQRRDSRGVSSRELLKAAKEYGRLISRLPFVRMVAITGSLAVDNADPGDDLDYLIVTAPRRVWLTRAMTMLIVRLAALRGVTLCPNYLLSEEALELTNQDFYTARELRQMLPVAGSAVYLRMLAANDWWRQFLPNAALPEPEDEPARRSFLRRVSEWLLSLPVFDRVEAEILARKGAELRQNAGPEAVFDETMCKGHFEGWRERTHRLVDERMKALLEQSV